MKIIHEKYLKIENVQCVAHSINLIACDIAKENFSDRLLQQVNTLTTFFRNSHQANQKIVQLIKEKGIVSDELKLYCKTYWTTTSESVDSVLNLKPVLQEIVTNHHSLLMNDKIKPIIQFQSFFFKFTNSFICFESFEKGCTYFGIKISNTC